MSDTEGHDRQHPTLTLGVLSLSALAYILLQSMVLPALPEIGKALNTSQSTVAWVLTAYLSAPPSRPPSSGDSVTCTGRSGCSSSCSSR